jgi:serine/threonine-protein kinase HipA
MLVRLNRSSDQGERNEIAGSVGRGVDSCVFTYDRSCPSDGAVSLTMPIQLESYVNPTLHPVFQMNLPEGSLRETILRKFRKAVSGFDDLDMLELIGTSQLGRLRFSDSSQEAYVEPQSIKEILHDSGRVDLLHHLLERYSMVSGVSGAQPKVLIRDDLAGEQVQPLSRLTVRDATHIVKTFDPSEYPELAANEFLCMQVAKRAGLDIPALQLSDNGRFLVVERFDKDLSGQYRGFEDFCALSGFGTDRKYDSSYERLAKLINAFVDKDPCSEARAVFFTSFAVTCAVKNGDAHLKNFGVLYDDPNSPVALSPTFDIVSTTPYFRKDTLALTLDGSKRFPNAKRLSEFGRVHCGLLPDRVGEIMEKVADSIADTRREVQRHMADRSEFVAMGELLLASWDEGVQLSLVGGAKKTVKSGAAKDQHSQGRAR